jgi:Na+/proline symporter
MNILDWIVLVVTLLAIIAYGLYKSRTSHNLDGYFLSNRSMPWGLVLLSIMGTQASAITFLSLPGRRIPTGCVSYNIISAFPWPWWSSAFFSSPFSGS